jgi:tetratricopeptide (TPR) repeat protein/tRNA A-37 threonylcarbamoyl transferase component Bud32
LKLKRFEVMMRDDSRTCDLPAAADREARLQRLRADQAERWRCGEPVQVESYLEREPALASDADALLDLVYSEVMLREEQGEQPTLEEYLRRFPKYEASLRRQFDLHQALAAASLLTSFQNPDTHPPQPVAGGASAEALPPSGEAAVPAAARGTIPGYEIQGELGRGGTGVVYKARQVSLNRVVALKMVLAGEHVRSEDLVRFLAESETVAALQHPHIVQIFEVGQHDGLPFFALEYLEGGSLLQKLQTSPLPAREAARVTETLARAMHSAHAHGVIHRDLKPSNVLLDREGRPKITDFGLAKRVAGGSGLTQTGAILGTPSYMAPEQAQGKGKEVGPAADVYALGAILYELLTGRPPFKAATPLETVLQVLHEEPVPPRRLQPQVPRDLETICLKSLDKEPARRYANAEDLAEDLRRYQTGEPIRARPVGLVEQGLKWARRYPAWAGLAASVVAAVLALMIMGGVYNRHLQWERDYALRQQAIASLERDHARQAEQEAGRQRARAETNLERALSAADQMLTRVGQGPLARLPQMELERRKLLEDALTFYQGFLDAESTDPKVRRETGRAYGRVGDVQMMLGRTEDARKAYNQAVALLEKLVADFPNVSEYRGDLATAYTQQGTLLRRTESPDAAEKAYRQALNLRQRLAADSPQNPLYREKLALTYNNLALALLISNRGQEAAEAFRQALTLRQALVADFPAVPEYRLTLARSLANVGLIIQQTRPAEAEDNFHRSVAMFQSLVQEQPHGPEYEDGLVKTHRNLGVLFHKQQRLSEAKAAYQEAIDLGEKLVADFPNTPDYLSELTKAYNNLGVLLAAQTQLPEAERVVRRLVQLREKLMHLSPQVPEYQSGLAIGLGNLANILSDQGKFSEALPLVEAAIRHQRAALGVQPRYPDFLRALGDHYVNLVVVLEKMDDHAGAAKAVTQLAQVRPTQWRKLLFVAFGPADPCALASLNNLTNALEEAGQFDQALALYRDLLDAQSRKIPAEDLTRAGTLSGLGSCLLKAGRPIEAEPVLRECLAILRRQQPDAWTTFHTQSQLGGSLLGQRKYAEAEPLLVAGFEGMKQREATVPANAKKNLTDALERLVRLYDAWDKPERAKEWRQKLEERKAPGKDAMK